MSKKDKFYHSYNENYDHDDGEYASKGNRNKKFKKNKIQEMEYSEDFDDLNEEDYQGYNH